MHEVLALFLFATPPLRGKADDAGTTLVAFRTGQPLDALLPSLWRLIKGGTACE
ncbi:hypothetical protein [Streptomyces sp. NPDC048623]|uniref:hypothetical protein n=1 Tax=Streptomyces sp. NPDC048623 TaxID=3155761 RepID=UPI003448FCDF